MVIRHIRRQGMVHFHKTKPLDHRVAGFFLLQNRRSNLLKNEPVGNGRIGEPPAYFDLEHQMIWTELMAESAPGVLCTADRLHFELTTPLVCRMRIDPARVERNVSMFAGFLAGALEMSARDARDLREEISKALSPSVSEMRLLVSCLVRMEMSPTHRISGAC